MNEYTAIVNDKKYIIKINKRNNKGDDQKPKHLLGPEEDASEACLNAILEEYQHSVRRSEKLDNKVYILSTICGFIFAFITSIISNLSTFQMPTTNRTQLWLVRIYFVITLFMSLLYLYTIFKLGILLTAKKILRLTPDYLILNQLYNIKEKDVRIFIACQYIKSINKTNIFLEKRFKKFNWCTYRTALIILLAFVLHFFNLFITKKPI